MNKKGLNKIQQAGIGSMLGVTGLIIALFGSVLNQIWIMRLGIALTTFGIWMVTWT